ncbi:MAG TPA: hypothetical protein VKP00_12845 [Gemmatimonadaceae bacterium]|nr:hypothetical protein [Gemmatimonadaceae bacterium]
MFGQYNDLAPKVAPTQGERIPQHLTVQIGRPANVAVFLVAPGRASRLLFPADSMQSAYVEAGAHLVETSLAKAALSDSSRLIRRPPEQTGGNRQPNGSRGRTGTVGRDSLPIFSFNQHGYLLIFASQEPLSYAALSSRVAGLSIPIEDGDALNTVTKLIRATTSRNGPWAAYATDFPP